MHASLTLSLPATVLVLVDLQEEHRADDRYLVEGYDQIVTQAAKLLDEARQAEIDMLHVAYVRDYARVPRRPLEPVGSEDAPTFSDPTGKLTAISPEVSPRACERQYQKNDMSCFCEPAFEHAINGLRPEWMIVCGAWTEACVSATVRDATAKGIRVLLVKDACGSGTAAMHMTGVIHMANRLYGGAVCDTATALKLMRGEACSCWQLRGTTSLRFEIDTIETVYHGL